jgi:hypothetical protein
MTQVTLARLSVIAALLFMALRPAQALDYRPQYDTRPWEAAESPGSEKDKELAEAQRLRDRAIARNPKRARFCVEQFGQDGEALETSEQQADFDYCMKSVSPKEICSVFGEDSEFESKAEYKRCLTRLTNGDEAYRAFFNLRRQSWPQRGRTRRMRTSATTESKETCKELREFLHRKGLHLGLRKLSLEMGRPQFRSR